MCSCSVFLMLSPFFVILLDFACVQKNTIIFQGEPSIASSIVPVVCTRTGRKHVASHCKEFVSRCAVRVYLYAHPCDPPIPHHPFYTRMSSSRFLTFFPKKPFFLSFFFGSVPQAKVNPGGTAASSLWKAWRSDPSKRRSSLPCIHIFGRLWCWLVSMSTCLLPT